MTCRQVLVDEKVAVIILITTYKMTSTSVEAPWGCVVSTAIWKLVPWRLLHHVYWAAPLTAPSDTELRSSQWASWSLSNFSSIFIFLLDSARTLFAGNLYLQESSLWAYLRPRHDEDIHHLCFEPDLRRYFIKHCLSPAPCSINKKYLSLPLVWVPLDGKAIFVPRA